MQILSQQQGCPAPWVCPLGGYMLLLFVGGAAVVLWGG